MRSRWHFSPRWPAAGEGQAPAVSEKPSKEAPFWPGWPAVPSSFTANRARVVPCGMVSETWNCCQPEILVLTAWTAPKSPLEPSARTIQAGSEDGEVCTPTKGMPPVPGHLTATAAQ
jgi:hypothetical protein